MLGSNPGILLNIVHKVKTRDGDWTLLTLGTKRVFFNILKNEMIFLRLLATSLEKNQFSHRLYR